MTRLSFPVARRSIRVSKPGFCRAGLVNPSASGSAGSPRTSTRCISRTRTCPITNAESTTSLASPGRQTGATTNLPESRNEAGRPTPVTASTGASSRSSPPGDGIGSCTVTATLDDGATGGWLAGEGCEEAYEGDNDDPEVVLTRRIVVLETELGLDADSDNNGSIDTFDNLIEEDGRPGCSRARGSSSTTPTPTATSGSRTTPTGTRRAPRSGATNPRPPGRWAELPQRGATPQRKTSRS